MFKVIYQSMRLLGIKNTIQSIKSFYNDEELQLNYNNDIVAFLQDNLSYEVDKWRIQN